MLRLLMAPIAVGLTVSLLPDTASSKPLRCKADLSGTRYSIKISKGRISAAGGTFRARVVDGNSIEFDAYGEDFIMKEGGAIVGRQAGTAGNHNCDMAAAIKAMKK